MTPDQIQKIRTLARDGDPYWRGAAWMLDQLTEPSPEPVGVSSFREETR